MIRGYFSTIGATRRPFIFAFLQFPALNNRLFDVEFLVDTGADRTLLSPSDARSIGIDVNALPFDVPSTGVSREPVSTRRIEAVLTVQYFSTPLTLYIPETPLAIPSVLGRNVISRFALFMEERTDTVLLLEPQEADSLRIHLPP